MRYSLLFLVFPLLAQTNPGVTVNQTKVYKGTSGNCLKVNSNSTLGQQGCGGSGTVTSVSGIANEIGVATGTSTPVISVAPTFDISGHTSTAPIKKGTSLPATCGVGEFYDKTDATAGSNLYSCTATNTWTTIGGSGGGSPAGSANCVQLTDGASAFISGCLADNTKPALIGPPLSAAGSDVVGVGGAIFNQIDTVPGDFAYGFSFVAETTQVDAGVTGGFLIGILNAGAGTGVGTSYGGESVLVVAGPSNYTGTGVGALASMDAQINFHGSGTIAEIYDYQSDANPGLGGSTRAIGILGSYHALNPCGVLDMVTATNCVGMKIDDVSGGSSTNKAIQTGLGNNYFGDTTQSQGWLSADASIGTTGNGFKNGLCVTTAGACPTAQPSFNSTTNCANAASPAVCVAAPTGAVAIPTGITTVSLVVNTTAVTANSRIFLASDDSLTIAATTCNNTLATLVGGLAVTARTPGASFTITYNGTIATNPLCVSYSIIN